MNLAAVRTLVETYTNHDLQQAEAQLLEGEPLRIDVLGEDEGEQLTHILAALWVRQHMAETGDALPLAMRAYTQRVRQSIT
jgi:hypothetical protein